jgi:hypothetical protein
MMSWICSDGPRRYTSFAIFAEPASNFFKFCLCFGELFLLEHGPSLSSLLDDVFHCMDQVVLVCLTCRSSSWKLINSIWCNKDDSKFILQHLTWWPVEIKFVKNNLAIQRKQGKVLLGWIR